MVSFHPTWTQGSRDGLRPPSSGVRLRPLFRIFSRPTSEFVLEADDKAPSAVRFRPLSKFFCPNPSLRRTERVRPSSASVLFGRYFIGPWSASVLEADVSEEKLPPRVLHRPASASVPGRPSPSRDPCFK